MGKRYVLGFFAAKRGRPNLRAVDAVWACRRFRELRAEGAGVADAEARMLGERDWKHLTCRQAVRKQRTRGEAVESDFAFKESCAAVIGPLGWFVRPDYFRQDRPK